MNRFSSINFAALAPAPGTLTLERFAIGGSKAGEMARVPCRRDDPGAKPGRPSGKSAAEQRRLIDLKPAAEWKGIRVGPEGDLFVSASTFIRDLAESIEVRGQCAALADAADYVASAAGGQDRTVGGELCQRPRCGYFQNGEIPCLKNGGRTCFAIEGDSKYHAIFGSQAPCRMVSPTNLGAALLALNGRVHIRSVQGERMIATADFFRMPTAEDPFRETILAADEMVSGISVARPEDGWRSAYLQISGKPEFDWAVVSAATNLNIGPDGLIRDIRLALNGVAPVPWRLSRAEDFLRGERADEANLREAARLALADAQAMKHNAYKVPIARALVARVIQRAGGLRS